MTEQTGIDTEANDRFDRQKSKEEMQKQVISFALMILFTVVAFTIVATGVSKLYAIPIIFLMAIIQAAFQFYYFMHMKEKDHGVPAALIYGGVWCAFLTLCGLFIITWW